MIATYYQLIDEAVMALGLNPEDTRGQQEGQWNLKKGRFDIMVDVWEQEKQFLFQIVCPLCSLPEENKEGFLLHLLQRNYGMSSLAYAIMDDSVFLKFTTEAETLTKDVLMMLFNKTAFYAEQSNFVPELE
jgi:hypothetical protein